MDLRIKKTRDSLRTAFITLRAKKSLEKITIKELTEMANINKATYYLHYHDIYDLSESLEREVVQNCLNGAEKEYIITDVCRFLKSLENSVRANEETIRILFEGSRSSSFAKILDEELTRIIEEQFPDYEMTLEGRMKMTFLIHGAYYTYFKYPDFGIEKTIKLLAQCSGGSVVLKNKN